MTHKTYFQITGIIFALITLLHISRVVLGWTAVIGDYEVPMWISYAGVVVAGFLASQAFRFGK